jgi:hypothetical protein
MSKEENIPLINFCKAVVQQGVRKGERCQRIKIDENEYCIYHQRNYEYDKCIEQGKKLCSMFFRGCNNELSMTDLSNSYKKCESCRLKKSGKLYQCKYDGCTFHIEKVEDKYCMKHIRQHLRDNENNNNIKYCDINRGCFNKIVSGAKCEACKSKEKTQAASTIMTLREKYNIQLAYIRPRSNLHHLQEDITISISELWRAVQKNAYSRSLLFTINQEEFEKLVIQPCYYCGFYSESRLNGIDRMNNNKGYIPQNCLPCCKMCNMIKNIQHPIEFLDKIDCILYYLQIKESITELYIQCWDSYLSKYPRSSYNDYKYDAKQNKIEFNLSNIQYCTLVNDKCYLCGIPKLENHTNGIDRYDAAIRCYSIENSRTCCGHCNVMKGIFTYGDFIEKCRQIKEYHCDRTIFRDIPAYNYTKCRNEFYTAEDIYEMMKGGAYMQYIEWCQEKDKSPEFISRMNYICNFGDLSNDNKIVIISQIKDELEIERKRGSKVENKNFHCKTVYSYLTQGKLKEFKEWYNAQYDKTSLFDEQLNKLMDSLPSMTREDGIKACKKFIFDEKNRRVIQQRRKAATKVEKYKETIHEKPASVAPPSVPPTPLEPSSLESKVLTIQQAGTAYQKKNSTELKQWKVKNIYDAILQKNEHLYKEHCEQNNTIDASWETRWSSFLEKVKGQGSYATSEPIIRDFIEDLRRLRHNALCYYKHANIIERDDRIKWPARTVVRAFLQGNLTPFKEFMEGRNNHRPEEAAWKEVWNTFIEALEKNREDAPKLRSLCSQFLLDQRNDRYRQKTA